jgi:hypothetical protein
MRPPGGISQRACTLVVCRWIGWSLLAAVIFITLSPIGWRPVTGAPPDLERFAAFPVLGGVFCFGYPKCRGVVLLLLVALAVSLETLQHLVPTRDGRVHDAAMKVLGGAVGVFVSAQLATWRPGRFLR